MVSEVSLDFETFSEIDLRVHGLDRYSRAAEVLMCAYRFDGGQQLFWQRSDGPFPRALAEALEDPHVLKWAFNAQFERVIALRALNLRITVEGWRCTQALAYMQSFAGGLEEIGAQIGLPLDKMKSKEGKRLIKMFCGPQRVTKRQTRRIRDDFTDPTDWEEFCRYCQQDEVSETAMRRRLIQYPVPPQEWRLYELDQIINDRGLPVDLDFVRGSIEIARRRTDELVAEMREITGLLNPNSTGQLLPWLRERGYPFRDLQKATVAKVLGENSTPLTGGGRQLNDDAAISEDCFAVLELRQWAARISTRKHNAVLKAIGPDNRIRYVFQYGGASRTLRWAGRRVQTQNLPRTPKVLEAQKGLPSDAILSAVTDCIRAGDYDGIGLFTAEVMEAIVGTVRSMIRSHDGYEIGVCDLAAIESRVIAILSGCVRLIQVFVDGRDPYKDFGQTLYRCAYEAVTKEQRTGSKPAVLGAGFRLGGGSLIEGKRTGLWGYAESMGVNMTQAEAETAVEVFRETYPEIPQFWYDLENAAQRCVLHGQRVKVGLLTFEHMKPYMTIRLPSGRRLFYYKPRIERRTFVSKAGKPYTKLVLTYMGQQQKTGKWTRIASHGGKVCENVVQATARDVLGDGMLRAHEAEFYLIGHAHDENIVEFPLGSNQHNVEWLREIMSEPLSWLPGIPLDAAGYVSPFYKKD